MHLIEAGLWSALAPTVAETQTALAEKRSPLRRQRGFMGPDFKPLMTGFRPLGSETAPARMMRLADFALDDLLVRLSVSKPATPTALALLLPEPDISAGLGPDALSALGTELSTMVAQKLPWPIGRTTLHFDGGPALASALAAWVTAQEAGHILCLAVDTFACRNRLLAKMARNDGSLFHDANPWGFIPGEGAAALLWGAGASDRPTVVGIALDREEIGEEDPGDSTYDGLTRACWSALPDDTQPVTRWLTDWNNSRYRAAEIAYVRVRIGERLAASGEPDHPAIEFGETGAAAPAMAVALHAETPGRLLITNGAPASNLRAALVVDTPERPDNPYAQPTKTEP